MRFPGLILASLLLLFLTACGGSDGNGDDDGSSPSSSESSQSQDGSSSDPAASGDGSSSEGDSADDEASEDPGDDAPDGDEGGSTEDLEAAFTEYTQDFFQGKPGDAYAFISPRCQEQTKLKDFGVAAASLAEAYGDKFQLTITDSDVEDGRGMVEAEYGSPELNEALSTGKYDWIYDDGTWLLDGCG